MTRCSDARGGCGCVFVVDRRDLVGADLLGSSLPEVGGRFLGRTCFQDNCADET